MDADEPLVARIRFAAFASGALLIALAVLVVREQDDVRGFAALCALLALLHAALAVLSRFMALQWLAPIGFTTVAVGAIQLHPFLPNQGALVSLGFWLFALLQFLLLLWCSDARRMAGKRLPGTARALLLSVVLLGLLAVVVPTHHHPRNEEYPAIGDLRTLMLAQQKYAAANAGLYGTIECLGAPGRCLRDYTGPTFVDPPLLRSPRGQYEWAFHPHGETTRPSGERGFESYAYTAKPVKGARGRAVRSFCVDSTGALRQHPRGETPVPVAGRCPATMELLM